MPCTLGNKSTPNAKYLGITLDRTLTYRQHVENQSKKLTSRVALLRGLAGSSWGAGADTLRTGTLTLVHSTAGYCVPAWCRSTHTRVIDKPINHALRVVSGCLKPTSTSSLPILPGIKPADLRRNEATLHLVRRVLQPNHTLQFKVDNAKEFRLWFKSRQPFGTHVSQLINSAKEKSTSTAQWANYCCNKEWKQNTSRLRRMITKPSTLSPGMTLPRAAWIKQNHLRTGVGRFRSTLHQCEMAPNPTCDCETAEQTAGHILLECTIFQAPNTMHELLDIDDDEKNG